MALDPDLTSFCWLQVTTQIFECNEMHNIFADFYMIISPNQLCIIWL